MVEAGQSQLTLRLGIDSGHPSQLLGEGAGLVHTIGIVQDLSIGFEHGVELVLDSSGAAILRILQKSNQEERDDSGHRVDDELPGINILDDNEARCPDQHQKNAQAKEPCSGHLIAHLGSELIECLVHHPLRRSGTPFSREKLPTTMTSLPTEFGLQVFDVYVESFCESFHDQRGRFSCA